MIPLGVSRSLTLADGMDSGGDGVSKEELDAYYSYKKGRETDLANEKATMAASRAARAAENATIYETVPGFEARRGTHMRQLNTDQWGRQPTYAPRHDQRTAGPGRPWIGASGGARLISRRAYEVLFWRARRKRGHVN